MCVIKAVSEVIRTMMLLYSTARVLARTIAPCPAASFSRVSTRPLCAYESTSVGSWRPYTSTSTFQPLSHKTQPTSRVCPPLPVVVRAYGSDGKGDYSGGVSLVQGASRGIGLEFVSMILYTSCSKFPLQAPLVYRYHPFTLHAKFRLTYIHMEEAAARPSGSTFVL